jgi:Pex19 protein family
MTKRYTLDSDTLKYDILHELNVTFIVYPVSLPFSRRQQYQGMQRLISLYETEPENSERLLSCMKEVQEYGLPPKEIIANVAPDLTLDDNGMPHLESLPECSIL